MGQYFDKETQLHHNYHRDYDPQNGGYIHQDPIGILGGRNYYIYTNQNPLSRIDPYGAFWIQVIGTIIDAAVGAHNASKDPCQSVLSGLLIGGAVGFAATFGAGPLATAFFAGGASAAGSAVQQSTAGGSWDPNKVKWKKVVVDGAIGAFAGVVSGAIGKMLSPNMIKDPGISGSAFRPPVGNPYMSPRTPRMLPRAPTFEPDAAISAAFDFTTNVPLSAGASSIATTGSNTPSNGISKNNSSGSDSCGC